MCYDALSDSGGERTSLARRAVSADDAEHVKYAKDAREPEWTDDILAVRGRQEELVAWHVVDEDHRRRHRNMWSKVKPV